MKQKIAYAALISALVSLLTVSCQKDKEEHGDPKQTKTYTSDVVKRWLGVQTAMLYRPTGNPFGFNPSRYMAYCGIALYESVLPGMPAYRTLHGQLTEMPAMPAIKPGLAYHWPTCANAVLATMTRKFFSTVPAAYNEQAINNLENELNAQYLSDAGDTVFQRSVSFGHEVAERIFEWSRSDNGSWPTAAFSLPPYYPGMWQPESGAPVNPYWGYNRLLVNSSLDNVVSPPLTYNADPSSTYYKEMKEVYTVSKSLTLEQKRIARYFNDANPGYPAGAHYISILKQVIEQFNPALDKAAVTYAKTGISLFDASTGSFKAKYSHLKERPFQFIRSVITPDANPVWQPYLSTPGFPDFPSNHAIFSSSVAYALSSLYGNKTAFTDASYEGVMADLGNGPENLGSRHYKSFEEMETEISMSRLYGGIHYRYSCEEGRKQGRKTAQLIETKLKFLKN
jgi:hypothetical protein